jgi:hypothetical protein
MSAYFRMKQNTRLRLEQGFFIIVVLIVLGLLVRGHSRIERLSPFPIKGAFKKNSRKELDAYIIKQSELDPQIVRDMASKFISDEEILNKFYILATQDDRVGLFKLTSEF